MHATTQGKELSGSEDKCTVTLLSVFLSKNGLLSKTQLLYGHLGDQPAIDKLASNMQHENLPLLILLLTLPARFHRGCVR